VFSLVDWVLLRPLPYPSPDELVKVHPLARGAAPTPGNLTHAEFERASMSASFASSVAVTTSSRVLSAPGIEPAHIVVGRISGDLFRTFGVSPVLGRAITAAEIAGGLSAAVISDDLWRQRFLADPNAMTRVVTLDGRPHTIVGVMPAKRGYPSDVDLWRPITGDEREDNDREYVMIARLAGGATVQRANVELAAQSLAVDDLQRSDAADVQAALIGLLASTAIVLVIACANVAALLGACAADRFSELAVRRALGATHRRVRQQLVTETVLLVTIGGAAGLAFGRWLLNAVVTIAPTGVPRLSELAIDTRIVGAGVAVTLMAAFIVAALGARFAAAPESRSAMMTRLSTRSTASTRGRRTVVAMQSALAVVLTVGAGLLARSVQQSLVVDHGLRTDHLLAVELTLRGRAAGDSQQLFHELIGSAQSLPGVSSAAIALLLPTRVAGPRTQVHLSGDAPGVTTPVTLRPVTPRYFETAGIPITSGRDFNAQDSRLASRVGLVNKAFVRDVFKGSTAVGARVTTSFADGELSIVGEVADVTPGGVGDRPALYVSTEQTPLGGGVLLIRTRDSVQTIVPQLRERLRSAAPALPLDRIHDVSQLLAADGTPTRFNMTLASAFALLAVILAAIGVYGLTAGEVIARWRELAVRLALGATRHEAFWTIIGPSVTAVSIGVVIGIAAAFVTARWIQSLLHGVGPADPVTFIAAPILLVIVGLTGATAAALKVLKADPATTLRAE
jgi:predicted permease